jgi:hypothetical protein
MRLTAKRLLALAGIYAFALLIIQKPVHAQSSKPPRPRIVVTCDPELDDNNSLIRFLLYSSDLDVEGLVYTSSAFHWKGDGK